MIVMGPSHIICISQPGMISLKRQKNLAHLDSVSGEAYRLRQMHRTDVRKLLYQFADQEDITNLHACVGAWREAVVQRKDLDHLENRLNGAKNKSSQILESVAIKWESSDLTRVRQIIMHAWSRYADSTRRARNEDQKAETVIERTLEKWGDSDASLVLHVAMRAWLAHVAAAREASLIVAARAAHDAEQNRLRQHCEGRVGFALMSMEGRSGELHVRVTFGCWRCEMEDQLRAKASAQVMSEADYVNQQREALCKKALWKLSDHEESVHLCLLLHSWHKFVSTQNTANNHEGVMDRAMLLWGNDHQDILGHAVLSRWHEYVVIEAVLNAKAQHLAETERLRQVHDTCMTRVLLKWDSGEASVMLLATFNAWSQIVDSISHRAAMSEVAARAEHWQHLHESRVLGLLEILASGQSSTLIHSLYAAWLQYVRDEKTMKQISQKEAEAENAMAKHHHVMERALARWGDDDEDLMVHSSLTAWHQYTARQRRGDSRRAAQEQRIRAEQMKQMHDADVECLVLKSLTTNLNALVHLSLLRWHAELTRSKAGMQMTQLQKYNDYLMEKILIRLDGGQCHFEMHSLLRAWGEFVYDSRHLRQTAVLEKLRERHKTDVRQLTFEAVGHAENGYAIMILYNWRVHLQDMKHLQTRGISDARHSLARRMAIGLQENERTSCLNLVMTAWRNEVGHQRSMGTLIGQADAKHAVLDAGLRRREQLIDHALLELGNGDSAIGCAAVLWAWALVRGVAAAHREQAQAFYGRMEMQQTEHRGNVENLVTKVFLYNTSRTLQIALGAWRVIAKEAHGRMQLFDQRTKIEKLIDSSLEQWTKNDCAAHTRIVLHVWAALRRPGQRNRDHALESHLLEVELDVAGSVESCAMIQSRFEYHSKLIEEIEEELELLRTDAFDRGSSLGQAMDLTTKDVSTELDFSSKDFARPKFSFENVGDRPTFNYYS